MSIKRTKTEPPAVAPNRETFDRVTNLMKSGDWVTIDRSDIVSSTRNARTIVRQAIERRLNQGRQNASGKRVQRTDSEYVSVEVRQVEAKLWVRIKDFQK